MTHLSLFQLCLPTQGHSRTTTLTLFHGVTLTLSQCMLHKTKLLTFSICPKTCLVRRQAQMRASCSSISPCLTCCCVTSHTNGNCDHTSIIFMICVFPNFTITSFADTQCVPWDVPDLHRFINAVFSQLSAPVGLGTVYFYNTSFLHSDPSASS